MNERLLGDVYKEVLAESGVDFFNGTYVRLDRFVQELREQGVQYRKSRDVRGALLACGVDGVISGMIDVPCTTVDATVSRHVFSTCSLSPKIPINNFTVDGNPRETLETIQTAAASFLALPIAVRMYLLESPEYDANTMEWDKGHVLEAFGARYRMRSAPTPAAQDMIDTLRVFFPDTEEGNAEALSVLYLLNGGEPLEMMELYDAVRQIPPEVVPTEWCEVSVVGGNPADVTAAHNGEHIKRNLEDLAVRNS